MTPSRDIKIRQGIEKAILTPNRAAMTTTMVRPMALDGQYAAAQLWKLDGSPLVKGRYFQLSTMLAEHLMLPAFPSARIKDRADQYDRMPHASFNHTSENLLAHEEIPRHLSERAKVHCCGWRTDGELPVYIYYVGTPSQYLTQREEVFGATAPFDIRVEDWLTDEENAFLRKWWKRYRCPYPYVYGPWNVPYSHTATWISPEAHPHLTALYAKMKAHFSLWRNATVHPPDEDFDDIVYVERHYSNGKMYREETHY